MNVLLTSCGLETEAITEAFLRMLPASPSEIRALFITTAAISPDAVEVLPKCLNDLLKCGIPRKSITVHDLHDPIPGALADHFDVVYLCGGDTRYLLRRVNEHGFRQQLLSFIKDGGVVLGVSAGSIIFSASLQENLNLLPYPLDVHSPDEIREHPGPVAPSHEGHLRLGNRQALILQGDASMVME